MIFFFQKAAEAHGLHDQDGILRIPCLFPLSPLIYICETTDRPWHRAHWVMCSPIPLQSQSSPSLQGLPLWSISRDHTSRELCEQFVWFLLPKLPSLCECFGEGREDKRCWRRSRSLPQGKEIMKRRGILRRKNKSNSVINFFFSWAPLSGEKHAVSLDLVPWISQKSWGRNCFRKHLWAIVSLPKGSWSAGTENSPHKCVFRQCFCWERGLKPRLDMRGHGWWMLLWDLVSSLCHLQPYWWHYCLSPSPLLIWILGSANFK